MKKIILILSIMFFTIVTYSQKSDELIPGTVTFITSKNVYVKFSKTDLMNIGDTLQLSNNNVLSPCLVITQKSSTSCVCNILNSCDIKKNDAIVFRPKIINQIEVKEETISIEELLAISLAQSRPKTDSNEIKPMYQQKIHARISAASYSSFEQNSTDEKHRMMYRFSLTADHVKNSKFSFETYLNYRQKFIRTSESNFQQNNFFRIYNLALRYDIDSTLTVIAGRKINNNASSLGAIDGLQVKKKIGHNYIGIIAGFKPDIYEYGFNPDLFEYGMYLGRNVNRKNFYARSTIGLLEQRNTGQIDRRYVYFQHSSTIGRKLNLFGSIELDTYNKINETVSNNLRLTNLYTSARYRFSRKFSLSISYDARKRVLYYETLKTEIERLLDDDKTRRGLRFRVTTRPMKRLNIGASYSKRFQSNRQNKSNNINGYATYSKLPVINGRLSVNFNMNTSNYLISKAISIKHSRTLIRQKLNIDLYFRILNTQYTHSLINTNLNYFGTTLSCRINRTLRLSLLGEMARRSTSNTFRLNAKIIKRL